MAEAAPAEPQQPSTTLYVSNLGSGLKKEDLRRALYQLFSAHGKVIDVVATRAEKMRDQAFIVFRDLQSATAARRREDGNAFLGKRMRIQYSRTKSHATVKEDDGPEALYLVKLGLHEAKTPRMIVSGAEKANIDAENAKKRGHNANPEEEEEEEDEEQPVAKKSRVEVEKDDTEAMEVESDEEGPAPVAPPQASAETGQVEYPHSVLAVSNLPTEATTEMLTVLFQQFTGYVSVRYQASTGNAQAFFDSWQSAAEAKTALDGFQMAKGVEISVKYATRDVQM